MEYLKKKEPYLEKELMWITSWLFAMLGGTFIYLFTSIISNDETLNIIIFIIVSGMIHFGVFIYRMSEDMTRNDWRTFWYSIFLYGSFLGIMSFLYYVIKDISWIGYLLAVFVGAELLFLTCDNKTPKKKQNKFWFTAGRKCISLLESALLITVIGGLMRFIYEVLPLIYKIMPHVFIALKWICIFLFWVGVIVVILWLYITINSLKYGDDKNGTVRKQKRKR